MGTPFEARNPQGYRRGNTRLNQFMGVFGMNLRNPFASRSGSNGGSSDSSPDSEQEPNAQEDDSPPSTGSESPPESEQSSTTQAPSPPPGVSGPETSDAAATSPTASPRTSRSSEPQPDSSSENAGKKDLEDAAKDLEKEAADRANDILRPLADATPKNADKTESSNSGGMFSGIEHAVTHPVETASDASDEAVDSGEAAIDTVSSALSKESLANAARGYSRFAETTSENVGEKGLLNSADALNFVQEGVDDAGFSGIAHGIGDIKHADQALTKGLTKGVIEAGNIPAVALLGSEAASAAPGAIRGGITDTLSVSEDVVTGDVGQAASDVIGGATAAGEFGAEVGGDVANAFIEHPYETTGFTVGLLGAGLVGGEAVGAARTASTAARETVVGSDLVGGTKTIPYSSITDESGALGGGSKFETSTSAPASDAVAEVSSRAVDQPSVVQEAAGGDSLLYHTTGGSLGSDLAIGEGSSELPGLFVAPDANSVGLRSTSFGATTRDFAESLKPRLPNFGGRTDRIAAFKGDAIDAMPESATGAGYEVRAADGSVVERGLSRKVAKSLAENVGDDAVVGPDRTTSGYQFLSGDAATETAYVRPTGSRTGELEAIYAPESQFTRTGESAVNVRVGGSTLNIPFTERTITYGGEKIPLDTYAPVEDLGASVEGAVETGGVSASDTTVSGSELASEYTPVSEVGESGTPVTRYQGAATGSASPTPAAPSTSSITSQPPITDSYPTGPESVFNTDVSFGRQPASDTRPPSSNEFSLPSETLQVSTGLPENSYPESSLGSTPTQEPVTSSGAPTRPPETASGGVPTAPPRDTDGFPPLDEPFTPPATPFSPPASSTPSEPGSGGPADEPAGPTGYEYPHWQESSSEDDSRRRRFDLDLGDQQLPEDEMTNRLFDQGWVNPVADAEEAFNRFVGGR